MRCGLGVAPRASSRPATDSARRARSWPANRTVRRLLTHSAEPLAIATARSSRHPQERVAQALTVTADDGEHEMPAEPVERGGEEFCGALPEVGDDGDRSP